MSEMLRAKGKKKKAEVGSQRSYQKTPEASLPRGEHVWCPAESKASRKSEGLRAILDEERLRILTPEFKTGVQEQSHLEG